MKSSKSSSTEILKNSSTEVLQNSYYKEEAITSTEEDQDPSPYVDDLIHRFVQSIPPFIWDPSSQSYYKITL